MWRVPKQDDERNFREGISLKGPLTIQFGNEIAAGVPLGRIGRPTDIAGTCLFLASEAGEYVNGGTSSSVLSYLTL